MPTCLFCAKEVPPLSSICPHCLRALPLSVTTERTTHPSPARSTGWMRPLILLLVATAAGSYAYRNYHHEATVEQVPETVAGPVTTTVAPPVEVLVADTASVAVPGGGHLAFNFSGDGRSGCHVHGRVQTLPGGNRRIAVSVVDRDGLADLDGGKTPRTYYDSGIVADVQLDINVDGRTQYALVVAHASGSKRPANVRIDKVVATCAD